MSIPIKIASPIQIKQAISNFKTFIITFSKNRFKAKWVVSAEIVVDVVVVVVPIPFVILVQFVVFDQKKSIH